MALGNWMVFNVKSTEVGNSYKPEMKYAFVAPIQALRFCEPIPQLSKA